MGVVSSIYRLKFGLRCVHIGSGSSLDVLPKSWQCVPTSALAKFGVEVTKESARNGKIAKKSLKAKSRAYAYAPKKPIRMQCHDLGVTS
ncbi:hypothetical protein PIB30_087335 [Stylosanthes scabra]|uniref:Uncharacterized protein n=1 Tax=Stylosanthes scabra TaxID=79078 RepID=A0ABU6US76_9FABA|nr:hypothetical protein [Stylosanthes scabra]